MDEKSGLNTFIDPLSRKWPWFRDSAIKVCNRDGLAQF